MFQKTRWAALLLAGATVFGAAIAEAQVLLNPFLYMSNKFTNEDMQKMMEASARLYKNDAIIAGTTTMWRNDKSGNAGIVTLVRRYDFEGMPCATVRHHFTVKGSLDPVNLHFDRCKTKDGEWKLR
jgi:surface antigen